jgi:hypothetical protein
MRQMTPLIELAEEGDLALPNETAERPILGPPAGAPPSQGAARGRRLPTPCRGEPAWAIGPARGSRTPAAALEALARSRKRVSVLLAPQRLHSWRRRRHRGAETIRVLRIKRMPTTSGSPARPADRSKEVPRQSCAFCLADTLQSSRALARRAARETRGPRSRARTSSA